MMHNSKFTQNSFINFLFFFSFIVINLTYAPIKQLIRKKKFTCNDAEYAYVWFTKHNEH